MGVAFGHAAGGDAGETRLLQGVQVAGAAVAHAGAEAAHQLVHRLGERSLVREALDCPGAPCILAGYSLAGLCALYALYRTALFSGAISASGSLWFPGFLDYAVSRSFPRLPERVYLSLGDRESRSRNLLMRRVEENSRAFCALLEKQGVDCRFERNPGNHFQDPEERLAKGIAWILRE